MLINRKENGDIARYAHIGTGNFHEKTARIYTDFALLTADPEITGEVRNVFGYIENPYQPVKFRHLVVSPRNSRLKLYELIEDEIENARAGKKAQIILKINNLVDRGLINKLYEASIAGVEIKMIIRGCVLLSRGLKESVKTLQSSVSLIAFLNTPGDDYS